MIDKSITYVNYNTGVYTDKLNFANRILAVYQILRVLKSVILSVILINTLQKGFNFLIINTKTVRKTSCILLSLNFNLDFTCCFSVLCFVFKQLVV